EPRELLKRHRFRSGHGVFEECTGKRDHPFNLTEALAAYVLEGLLQSGDISLDEGKWCWMSSCRTRRKTREGCLCSGSSALQHV
ncbi:hypothetical protein PO124_30805, partial [Bacillus licheniformis]|nr:hypothetical protein [Bacillus licheniformis]